MASLSPFERALVAHLVADWLLQNEWLATHKASLRHPAAWLHAGVHSLALGAALGWRGGLALGCAHLLIDTRAPLAWWQTLIGQRREGPLGLHIALWADQVLHIASIAAWIALAGEPFYDEPATNGGRGSDGPATDAAYAGPIELNERDPEQGATDDCPTGHSLDADRRRHGCLHPRRVRRRPPDRIEPVCRR